MPWYRGPCRCGFGPHAWIWYPGAPPYPTWYVSKEEERRALEKEKDALEARIKEINRRLRELRE